MQPGELLAIAPMSCMTILALLVLTILAAVRHSEEICYWVATAGLLVSAFISLSTIDLTGTAFNRMVTVGGTGSLFAALFSLCALLTVVLSRDYIGKGHVNLGEFYLLIILASLGMMLMAAAADLIVIFLGLELMSLCLYVLAGFTRDRAISNESSLKYFLLGAFATGFLLYGIALLYGAAGTTNIEFMVQHFNDLTASTLFWTGFGLLLVGFAFKVGAVPFHMWIPDVYQGSPTTISGFMSTAGKAAAFAAFLLVFSHREFTSAEKLRIVLAILSAASMILGNIVAVTQSNIKRMLAYSSIAHAGYMLAGLAAGNQLGKNGILFYLVTYMFMNIGAFGILSVFELEGEMNLSFDDYTGLGRKRPFLAALMSIFMISLAGIPPFAGFFGKYYIFLAAINAHLTWLAIIGVLTSVVSIYYYLRLVVVMFFQEGETQLASRLSKSSMAVLSAAAVAVIEFGIFPSSILSIINNL